jgi:predicted nucleotidyltransferase
MAKKRIKQIVLRLINALTNQNIKTDKVILFGSYATGDYRKDSDLDLLFISSDFTGCNLLERTRILGRAHWEVPDYPMDLVAITPQEWKSNNSLIINYAKKGKIIYS